MEEPVLYSFFKFLKNPKQVVLEPSRKISNKLNFLQKTLFFIKILSFSSIAGWLLGILGGFIVQLLTGYSATENNLIFDSFLDIPPLTIFLLIVVIGPFAEEVAFRLFFTTKKRLFFTGVIFFSLYLINSLSSLIIAGFNVNLEKEPWVGQVFLYFLVFIILLILVLNLLVSQQQLKTFLQSKFNWFFYITSISFGLIHITNYTNLNQVLWVFPMLLLPQFLLGFVFGFLRSEFNFLTTCLAHSVYNFFLGGMVFLLLFFLDMSSLRELVDSLNSGQITALLEVLDSDGNLILNFFTRLLIFSYFLIFSIFVWVIFESLDFLIKKKVGGR